MFQRRVLLVTLALMLVLMGVTLGAPAWMISEVQAASVTPTHIPGASNTDKTCAVVMPGTIELKIEPVNAPGTTESDGYLSVSIVVPSTDGTPNSFDWTATATVLGVIVKDGVDGANWYDYRPEGSKGDTNLQTPFDGARGISHISFCYRPALRVTKIANTTFTRTFSWTINKSVTPDTWDLFTGDSGTSEYTVAVTKDDGVDSDWEVDGTITIFNPHPSKAATITGVTDSVGGVAATVTCPVTFPYSLAGGSTLTCSYNTKLPDGTPRTNTATVTTSGDIDGGTGTASVTFGDPTTVVYDEVTVSDTNAAFGGPFTVDDDKTWTYSRTFTCDDDEGDHPNTATINETGQSNEASVTVNCHALQVTKDAKTAFTRTWNWTIEKVGDQTDLTLSVDQPFTVNYDVTVSATYGDDAYAVSGKIKIYNPAPIAATLNGVVDVVSPDIAATVECGVPFPYTLAADATLECGYDAVLPDAASRTNTATATQQNYDYDSEVNGVASGTTDYIGSANVDFAGATISEVDECVDVNDDQYGDLGQVCAGIGNQSFLFEYTLDISYEECGEYEFVNIASFITNDTGTTRSDDHTVVVNVPCAGGCTLTQGYWRTHSKYGPAPYDDTWEQIGEDTIFFKSGQTYYEVLWTSPRGNAYYILAHQYIAAELNQLNGAAIPADVLAAFNTATGLLNTHTPAYIATLKGNNSLRQQFTSLAGILDDYNNGVTGPGHCSEDRSSGARSLDTEAANTVFLPLVRQ